MALPHFQAHTSRGHLLRHGCPASCSCATSCRHPLANYPAPRPHASQPCSLLPAPASCMLQKRGPSIGSLGQLRAAPRCLTAGQASVIAAAATSGGVCSPCHSTRGPGRCSRRRHHLPSSAVSYTHSAARRACLTAAAVAHGSAQAATPAGAGGAGGSVLGHGFPFPKAMQHASAAGRGCAAATSSRGLAPSPWGAPQPLARQSTGVPHAIPPRGSRPIGGSSYPPAGSTPIAIRTPPPPQQQPSPLPQPSTAAQPLPYPYAQQQQQPSQGRPVQQVQADQQQQQNQRRQERGEREHMQLVAELLSRCTPQQRDSLDSVLSAEEQEARLLQLHDKLEAAGVGMPDPLPLGYWLNGLCPFCGGGKGREQSFGIIFAPDLRSASWKCFRAIKCAIQGTVWAENRVRRRAPDAPPPRPELPPVQTREPLDEDALQYFEERGISAATLQRAGVFQIRREQLQELQGEHLRQQEQQHVTQQLVLLQQEQQQLQLLQEGLRQQQQQAPPPQQPQQDLRMQEAQLAQQLQQLQIRQEQLKQQLLHLAPPLDPRAAAAAAWASDGALAAGAAAPGVPVATAAPSLAAVVGATLPPSEGAPGKVLEGLKRLVVYPHVRQGVTVNATFHDLETGVRWQTPGAEQVLWGLDDVSYAEQAYGARVGIDRKQPQPPQQEEGEDGRAGGELQQQGGDGGAWEEDEDGWPLGDEYEQWAEAGAFEELPEEQEEDEDEWQFGDEDELWADAVAVEDLPERSELHQSEGGASDLDGGEPYGSQGVYGEQGEEQYEGEQYEEEEEYEGEEQYEGEEGEAGLLVEDGEEQEEGEEREASDEQADEQEEGEVGAGQPWAQGGAGSPGRSLDGVLVIVETELDRLSMMEAGVPNVLSLPPNAAAAWARYKAASAAAAAARDPTHSPFASRAERLRQAAKWSSDPARTARLAEAIAATDPYNTPLLDMPLSVAESAAAATSAAAAGAVSGGGDPLVRAQAEAVTAQQLREPTGYLWSCRAVLQPDPQRCPGLPERVVLALREGPDSAELAQELSRKFDSRAALLRWPATLLDLPPNSISQEHQQRWGSGEWEVDAGPEYLQEEYWEQQQPTDQQQHQLRQHQRWEEVDGEGGTDQAAAAQAGEGEGEGPLRSCANDVLVKDGPEALRWLVVNEWEEVPELGLLTPRQLRMQLLGYYLDADHQPQPCSTGWKKLDTIYRVAPGELTVVTGVPNSGKSNWLDALAVNMVEQHGWKIAFASFEKSTRRHVQHLIEMVAGEPLFPQTQSSDPSKQDEQAKMDLETYLAAFDWIKDNIVLIRHEVMEDDFTGGAGGGGGEGLVTLGGGAGGGTAGSSHYEPCTIDWILKTATLAVREYKIKGLVIDPYNELEAPAAVRHGRVKETDYISAMLSKVKRWAQQHKVHVWLVAHPRALDDWDGGPPNLYQISGSAHWGNKADMVVAVHRYTDAIKEMMRQRAAMAVEAGRRKHADIDIMWKPNETQIRVLKARNKASGAQGDIILKYLTHRCKYIDDSENDYAYY